MELSTRDERMDWMIQWCQFDENEIDSLEHYIQHYDDYILHEDLCPSFSYFPIKHYPTFTLCITSTYLGFDINQFRMKHCEQ